MLSLTVLCPRCKSRPGDRCRRPSGKVLRASHLARILQKKHKILHVWKKHKKGAPL